MIRETEIRQKLASLLLKQSSLEDFEDWLVPQSWDMHRDSSMAAQNLVSEIELSLSEFSSGHRTYDDLRRLFASLLDQIYVDVAIAPDFSVANLPRRDMRTRSNSYQVTRTRPLPIAV